MKSTLYPYFGYLSINVGDTQILLSLNIRYIDVDFDKCLIFHDYIGGILSLLIFNCVTLERLGTIWYYGITLLLFLPTPLTLVCGGNPIIPILVPQPTYHSIWSAAPSFHRGLSTNPGVTVWRICGSSCRYGVCRVCECYRRGILVMDVFWCLHCVNMI